MNPTIITLVLWIPFVIAVIVAGVIWPMTFRWFANFSKKEA